MIHDHPNSTMIASEHNTNRLNKARNDMAFASFQHFETWFHVADHFTLFHLVPTSLCMFCRTAIRQHYIKVSNSMRIAHSLPPSLSCLGDYRFSTVAFKRNEWMNEWMQEKKRNENDCILCTHSCWVRMSEYTFCTIHIVPPGTSYLLKKQRNNMK